jgi:hypothetical protein
MKNSHSDDVSEEPVSEWFDREKVIRAFGKLGLIRDYEAGLAIVLRNAHFPFRRLILPSHKTLHVELLKLYAQDLRIPLEHLIKLLK